MVAGPSWIDTAKGATVEAVAGELGLEVRRRAFGPCPGCGAERRGGADRRPPCGIGEGWRCFACKVGGDALDLVARVVAGARLRELTPERVAEVRAWYAARGWCDPAAGGPAAPVVARRAPVAPAEPAPVYPPVAEVAALWSACAELTDVPWGYRGGEWADPAVPWLEKRRGLLCRALGALELARLLPLDPDAHPWPSWVPWRGMDPARWLQLYRLAVPMYDATGALRSLRFRAVTEVCAPTPDGLRWRSLDVKGNQKALAPKGSTVRGLALADPVGRALLAGELASAPWDGRVVVTEGEPDLWTWSTRQRRGMAPDALTWAVLGVVSGSWTEDLAARVPSGCKVSVRTHADADGDKYAERIRGTLAKRCEVWRAVIPGEREED